MNTSTVEPQSAAAPSPFTPVADYALLSDGHTVECVSGSVEVELICKPVFDYGRELAEWSLVGDDRHVADASGAGQTIRLQTDLALGIEANRLRARHVLHEGEELYCTLSWADPQAFSHLALIEAAARIILAERLEELT